MTKRSRNATYPWKPALNRVLSAVVDELGIGSDGRAQALLGAVRAQDYVRSLDLADSLASQQYASAGEHFAWNQLAYLIKKCPLPAKGIDREAAARRKFYASEHRCKWINRRFIATRRREARGKEPRYATFLDSMRKDIRSLLGPSPNLEKILSAGRFGPGAAVGLHGDATHLLRKLGAEELTVTPSAVPYVREAFWHTISSGSSTSK